MDQPTNISPSNSVLARDVLPITAARSDAACASALLKLLIQPDFEPLFRRPTRFGSDSAWYGHVPFAGWVIRACCPRVFVELGTYAGVSYAAFCDSVLAERLPTRCFAVDTWKGDEHNGYFDEDVFTDFSRVHDARYGGFSRLLRCTFDEALPYMPEGSIDLLHVDGRHLLEDVSHDYTTWLPKLSERAVVLFHDTNVRERNFGVWKFWDRLRRQHPSFEFIHEHGLGILAVGSQAPEPVLALCRLSAEDETGNPKALALLRERFALLGERWDQEFRVGLARREVGRLARAASDSDALRRIEGELRTENATLAERLAQADQLIRSQTGERSLLLSDIADAKTARHMAELRENQVHARFHDSEDRLLAAARSDHESLTRAYKVARTSLEETRQRLVATHAALEQWVQKVMQLHGSSSWRVTQPLRRLRSALILLRDGSPEPTATTPPVPPLVLPPVLPEEPPPTKELLSSAVVERAKPDWEPPRFRPLRRIMFVVGEPGSPGSIYRCMRNAAACRAAGYEADVVDFWEVSSDKLAAADLLVIWRALHTNQIDTMIKDARQAGTRIAFDIDDLMVKPELARIEIIDGIRTTGGAELDVQNLFAAMHRTMRKADFCIATTETLARHLRDQHDVVHVLPNSFGADTVRTARYARRRRLEGGEDGLIRLGYAGGTRTHQKDFATIARAVAHVLEQRPDTRLVLFREKTNHRGLLLVEEFPELAILTDRIEWRDMVPLDLLPAELARFDVSLCPLEQGNPFCESKSELKYFESALAGVCLVATPTEPFRNAIEDGVTGFLPATPEDWEPVLMGLVDNAPLRKRVAKNAYHDVLFRFGPERQAQLAATLFAQYSPGPEASRAFEFSLRRDTYLVGAHPEVPASELLFAHDMLGEAEVTVAMTSYNYQQHIIEALDSIRKQTLKTIDLVVVDDCSTDQSVSITLEWARRHCGNFNRIRILRTCANAGLGGARNVLVDEAETPWILSLDSDNRLLPQASEHLLAALCESPSASFAYPQIRQFEKNDAPNGVIMGMPAFDPARLATGNYIDAMAMFAKSAWAAAGGYYVRRDAMGWEDFDLWCRFAELGFYGVAVPEILAEYRVHSESMVNAITEQDANKRSMVTFVESRHPWLRLRTRHAKQRAAQPTASG